MDIKAAKTVIITIMAFAVCYVPNVCIGIWILFNSEKFVMYVSWPGQVFHLCLFLSSVINPFIYCLRLRRFRCALKQLLSNPCGRTPFQETNNKRQVRQRIPHQVPRGEKNMDESNQAILMLFNNSNLRTRRMAFTPRVSETRERSEKKEKECVPGVGNQVMTLSIKELQPPNIPRLAWVKKHSADSAATSFREESPTLKADNTRHVVTVEGKWTESRQTRIFQLENRRYTSNEEVEHSGKVRIEEEYIDPKEKPSNQENKESLSTGKDTTWDLTAEGQAVPSELSSSHKTMESLLTSADKTGEFTTEEHANPKVMRLSNQNMVEALPISTDKTGEITAEGQAVLNELSSNQKTRESSPTIEE
ncbi:unnamed protein product [Porites evermanni]|uniref:G-protein coupled receptors family 1 profile domain-containing protein n=1 Tax=Porites evermanni TaxID=104178 RepID=A0ABN8LWW3_9CNID|nr:unnamed protein product [Porites evermanni]